MDPALLDSLLEILVGRLDNTATGAPLVDWATRALESGIDAPALVVLAGLPRGGSVAEAGPLLDRGLAELGLQVLDASELRRAYVGAVSRALLAGNVDLERALELVHRSAVGPLGHPDDLMPWCFLWEGLDPHDYHLLSGRESALTARQLAMQWASYSGLGGTRNRGDAGGA